MAIYAIGDVQGCYDELQALLKLIQFNPDRDQLWFCGDLVNRGPKSLETLRYIRSLGDSAVIVLGNHDLHLLATAYDHQKPGKKDTLNSLLKADDAEELLDWLRHCKLLHHDDKLNLTLLHAGIHPHWSIEKAVQLAREVEDMLQSEHHISYYRHMYGDKPFNWDDGLGGWSRYRFITNIFTRLRYCDIDGSPALGIKGAPGSQPAHLYPWYEVPGRITVNDPIIFGHWSTLPHAGRKSINNTWAIDSGCLWGGHLTAMRVDEQPFVYTRFDCPGARKPPQKYLKPRRKKNGQKSRT